MGSLWKKLMNVFSPPQQQIENQNQHDEDCCFSIFLDNDEDVLHISDQKIFQYNIKQLNKPSKIVDIKYQLDKRIYQVVHIPGTHLIAVILVDSRLLIVDYKLGDVKRIFKKVNMICKLSKQSIIVFGINTISSVSLRTYKTLNQINTSFSSPVFTVDVSQNLIVLGSYWDIYLLSHSIQMKFKKIRAHNMNILCVKFINSNTVASTSEDFSLILWEIQIEYVNGDTIYTMIPQATIYLSGFNVFDILHSPFNKSGLLLNSKTQIKYIIFNQPLNESDPLDFSQLRYQSYSIYIDQYFSLQKQQQIKSIKINLKNQIVIANLKEPCQYKSIQLNLNKLNNDQKSFI